MHDPQRRTQPVVVTLPAEIDIANADCVGEELCAAFAPGIRTVIADMTGTRFCDSSGISVLVVAHRKAIASNAELRLVAVTTEVLRALTLVRIDHLLPVYPSLAEALKHEPVPEPPTVRLSGDASPPHRGGYQAKARVGRCGLVADVDDGRNPDACCPRV
jgi:anti-anti-sigma factor